MAKSRELSGFFTAEQLIFPLNPFSFTPTFIVQSEDDAVVCLLAAAFFSDEHFVKCDEEKLGLAFSRLVARTGVYPYLLNISEKRNRHPVHSICGQDEAILQKENNLLVAWKRIYQNDTYQNALDALIVSAKQKLGFPLVLTEENVNELTKRGRQLF